MKTPNKYIQWIILIVLYGIGIIAFIVIMGDENPEYPISAINLIIMKIVAIFALFACVNTGKYLYRIGILRKKEDKEA